ncbi:MAG: PD-(D/E)XK nuclease family protein [Oscillospiraceae bacterium]|nr:PD-(D/E)XK nuclease family protein [Oscillospiraceae bacterium]
MLNIITGRAGSGKTQYIMNEIKRRMDVGETNMLLIVPEQYSHDAERTLCTVCGDALSLHAEVISFTRLCDHVFAETGGATRGFLEKGGQILLLYSAIESVAHNLKVFGIKKTRTEVLENILKAITEFETLKITPEELMGMVDSTANPLSDKLFDIALIYDSYKALLQTYGDSTSSRLNLLAEKISESSVGDKGHIYIDGFNDFTVQEISIIEKLLAKDSSITVCLTSDDNNKTEIFEIPQRTIRQLESLAKENNSAVILTNISDLIVKQKENKELEHLEKYLFDDKIIKYSKKSDAISIYAAPSIYTECEYAAAKIWELIRAGYRWQNIGVMSRDWTEYESICENVFEKYDIPYFSSGKVDILSKPPMALIDAALNIAASGFDYRSVFRYLKTGLIHILAEEIAVIENYVLVWDIKGTMWLNEWKMPPSGYRDAQKGDTELLEKINKIRIKIITPLQKLQKNIRGDSTTEVKLFALYEFLTDVRMAENLVSKSEKLRENGNLRLADEYIQLIDIIYNAMDQMYNIIATNEVSAKEFYRLIMLVLSQNDVGVIPISLDRIALGSMTMSRRRDLKALILLGITDKSIPSLSSQTGILSDNERVTLSKLKVNIPAGLEERLYREMNMIYSTLTLPSEELVLMYTTSGGNRPSFIIKKLESMFDLTPITLDILDFVSAAEKPYNEYMKRFDKDLIQPSRKKLSEKAAIELYGTSMTLSASRVDTYYSCPFKHYIQSGLRLKRRTPAVFDASSSGSFMHFILANVFDAIKGGAGIRNITEAECENIINLYVEDYKRAKLYDFQGKNSRFIYLFNRLKNDITYIVQDIVEELKSSQFEPMAFEMNLSKISSDLQGSIDRVDGFIKENKLYTRVIDYKTSKTAYTFDLSDILAGRDMQMLIYIFALQKHGKAQFSMGVEPAAVLYMPARDNVLTIDRNATEEEVDKIRTKNMQRSGLVLDDVQIIDAMEDGENKKYLPIKTNKDGIYAGNSLVNKTQIEALEIYVDKMLNNAKTNILYGNNTCKPYYRSETNNACIYCEYHAICAFDEELGDRRKYVSKKKPDEVWGEIIL